MQTNMNMKKTTKLHEEGENMVILLLATETDQKKERNEGKEK